MTLSSLALHAMGCGNDRDLLDVWNPEPQDASDDHARDSGPRTDAQGPDAPAPDAAPDASDAASGLDAASDGAMDVAVDGSADATDARQDAAGDAATDGRADAAADAPSDATADGATDAGPSARCATAPTIDGVVGTDWPASAPVATNSVATAWTNNALQSLRVCYDDAHVYLGVQGTVEALNAIVVYLDRDFAGGPGGSPTGISAFSALNDHSGSLDSHASASLALSAAVDGFGAEGAWGTVGMPSGLVTDLNDAIGLRLFWPAGGSAADGGTLPDRRSDFAWISGVQSQCSASGGGACETAIPWASLFEGPPPASTTLGLFVRINNGDGTQSSNQTLPEDAPTVPRTVNRVMLVHVSL